MSTNAGTIHAKLHVDATELDAALEKARELRNLTTPSESLDAAVVGITEARDRIADQLTWARRELAETQQRITDVLEPRIAELLALLNSYNAALDRITH